MRSSRVRLIVILAVVAICVSSDQVTKHFARVELRGAGTVRVVGDVLVLRYADNSGAFLSLGSSWSPTLRTTVFGVASALLVIAFAVYTLRSARVSMASTVALALVLGGGIGNLIDRVTRAGLVTDFLNLGIGRIRTGIFNLADLFLMTGVFMVLVLQFRHRRPHAGADRGGGRS